MPNLIAKVSLALCLYNTIIDFLLGGSTIVTKRIIDYYFFRIMRNNVVNNKTSYFAYILNYHQNNFYK